MTAPRAPANRAEAQKQRARRMVCDAIKRGALSRPTVCQECGAIPPADSIGRPGIQGHHEDHGKPLVVKWLCVKCHRAVTPLPPKPGAPVYGDKNGMRKHPQARPKGERHGSALLTEITARDVLSKRLSAREFARVYGLSVAAIRDLQYGRTWRHLSASPYAPGGGA